MKRKNFLTVIISIFFIAIAFHGGDVYAQTAISGDEVCGKWDPVSKQIVNPCGVNSLKTITQSIFRIIIGLGLPLLVVSIIYRFVMAWYSAVQGNANAYKEAGRKATEAIIGFIIIAAIAGGITLAMFKYIGVKQPFLKLLESTSFMEVIPRAYAATDSRLSFVVDQLQSTGADVCGNYKDGSPCLTTGGKDGICYAIQAGSFCTKFRTPLTDPVPVGKCAVLGHSGDLCLTAQNENGMCITTGQCIKILSQPEVGAPIENNAIGNQTGSQATGAVTSGSAVSGNGGAVTSGAAQSQGKMLPNPLGFNSLYDFILGVLNMVMKFFLYPALIGIWVWAGFLYIDAQGAPEKLLKAHKLLFWAVMSTLVVFMVKGFLTAIKGSVDKLVPAQTRTISPVGAADGRVAPKDGQIGSTCTLDDGITTGIYGGDPSDPTCFPSGRR